MQIKIRTFVALMALNTKSTVPHPIAQKDASADHPKVLLVIPTLNEEGAIGELVNEAHGSGFSNILVVDGFSSDRTREIAEAAGARVVLQDFGKGKGCGVRTGMNEFLHGRSDLLCIIDGDGTNEPASLASMVALVQERGADAVLGSRTRGPRESGAMGLLTLASNLTVSFLLGAKFGRIFTDVQTGYWVFTRHAVEVLYPEISSTGFEIELELFVKALRANVRFMEVPVAFRRRKGSTKFSFKLRMRNLYYAMRFLASWRKSSIHHKITPMRE